jgi:hypothetical protein
MQSIEIARNMLAETYKDTVYSYTFRFNWKPNVDYVERIVKANHGYTVAGPSDKATSFGQHYIKCMTEVIEGLWLVIIIEPYLD